MVIIKFVSDAAYFFEWAKSAGSLLSLSGQDYSEAKLEHQFDALFDSADGK